jgi:hypothetical protein
VSLTSCWQCELDIPHFCYAGVPNAGWGMTEEAVAALETAQRHGFMLSATQRQKRQRRRSSEKKRRAR